MKWSVKSLSEIILHINVYLCVKIFVNCKPDFIVDDSKTYPLELKKHWKYKCFIICVYLYFILKYVMKEDFFVGILSIWAIHVYRTKPLD